MNCRMVDKPINHRLGVTGCGRIIFAAHSGGAA
jgi:hypothetical protein